MKDQLYTIGQVSEMIDVPVKTIRYYESVGLCTPSQTDRSSSYRYYSVDDIFRLDLIRCLGRQLGMPLKTIRLFLDESGRTDEEMIGYLKAQESELDEQIRELQRRKEFLSRKISAIQDIRSQKMMEPELVRCDNLVLSGQNETICTTGDALLRVRRLAALYDTEENYELFVVTDEPLDRLSPSGEVFVGIRGNHSEYGLSVVTVPEGQYARIRFLNRCHGIADAGKHLSEFIRTRGLHPCGPAVFSGNLLNATSASSLGYCLTLRVLVKESGQTETEDRLCI